MPVDLDLDLGIEAARDSMRAVRVEDAEVPRPRRAASEVVETLVQLAEGGRTEIHHLHRRVLALGDGHQTSAFSQA